MKSYMYSI